MARFTELDITNSYDIVDADTGDWITQGVQGSEAMQRNWPDDAQAWPQGEREFEGSPVDVAG